MRGIEAIYLPRSPLFNSSPLPYGYVNFMHPWDDKEKIDWQGPDAPVLVGAVYADYLYAIKLTKVRS